MKFGRHPSWLLLALAATLASCLTPPAPPPESAYPSRFTSLPNRPAPAKAWAGDGECLASAPARSGDEMGTKATDLIIRTIQRSDPWYQLLEVHVAVDRTVLGSSERAGVRAPDQFVRVPGVAVGAHAVSVVYLLRNGSGDASLRGFKFKVRSSYAFTIAPAQTTCISILLYFDPDLERPANERPRVDFREKRAPM